MSKVLHLFTEVSMSNGHNGLITLAAKKKLNVRTLPVGDFALFINKRLTAMKLFGANNVIVHYKAPDNRPIDPRALRYVPKFVSETDIGYDGAVVDLIRKKYAHLFRDEHQPKLHTGVLRVSN